jgi:hypothetical protein
MKTFCVLEQGKTVNHEITLKKKEVFTTADSDFFRLNWKYSDDPNATVCKSGIVWSEGRSLLYELAPKHYDYYVFLDEDIVFESQDPVAEIRMLLDKYNPIAATFSCEDRWTYKLMKRTLENMPESIRDTFLHREAYSIKCFDLCTHVFSADFANLMFPVPYHGSGRSMHYAQWVCSTLQPGKQICFGNLKVRNLWNDAHEDGLNEREHMPKIMKLFNDDTFDRSFDYEGRWKMANMGYENVQHSLLHWVNPYEKRILESDLARIYNINNPGFARRQSLVKADPPAGQ